MLAIRLLFFLILSGIFSFPLTAQSYKRTLDASILQDQGIINLDGTWEFYEGKYLNYEDFNAFPSRSADYIEVPGTWNSQGLPHFGFGTYRLKIKNLPLNKILGFTIPNVYSSYTFYLNDQLIAKNGITGTSAKNTTPSWMMKTVAFESKSPEAEIIIHVANFHHNRGGIHKSIYFGDFEALQTLRENEMLAQMMIISGLLVLSAFFIGMFIIRWRKKGAHFLYFSLLCFSWAARSFFAHIYLRSFFFPEMDWTISVKMEYLLLCSSLIFGNLFVNKAFNLIRGIGLSSILLINMLFILITIALPPQIFTAMLSAYLLITVVNFAYIIYAVIDAIIKRRPAATYAGTGLILGVFIFSYEIFSYQFEWDLNHIMLQSAYLLLFMIMSFILAHEFYRQELKIEELEENQVRLLRSEM